MADKNRNLKKEWVGAEKYVQLGIALPAATFIGWALGALLDHWLGTHWIFIVGLLLGIAAGFVQLIRVAISAGNQD